MYEPPRNETDSNPYHWDTQEYNQFENDLNVLRRSNRVNQQMAVPLPAPVRTASSAGGSCLLDIGVLCLAVGAITWYFGEQGIPYGLFLWGSIFFGMGLVPKISGTVISLLGVGIIYIGGHSPEGFNWTAVPISNWIVGSVLFIFGGWIVLSALSDD